MNKVNILIRIIKIFMVMIVVVAFVITLFDLFDYYDFGNIVEEEQEKLDLSVGWEKFSDSQILGNDQTGTLFDPDCMIEEEYTDKFRMYVSKRNEGSIVLYTSEDGINFNSQYETIIAPEYGSQYVYNRPSVLKHDGKYYIYYTRQIPGVRSEIYYGISEDGIDFEFYSDPVIIPTEDYEKDSVMNPNVIYDEEKQEFRMYYVAGEICEPDHVCIATSKDGKNWEKRIGPILSKNQDLNTLDFYKVGATDVHYIDGKYYMFYIGYTDISTARILLITSEDGINFDRENYKVIVEPDENGFDKAATYKPSAVYDEIEDTWYLYYNGRTSANEYIGLYIK